MSNFDKVCPSNSKIIKISSRKHIAAQRSSLSLTDYKSRCEHRRSESLDTPINTENQFPLSSSHHSHKRNYSMEPQELLQDFAVAVEGLNLITLNNSASDAEMTHDYAEIYTPSVEKTPIWLKNLPAASIGSSSPTSTSATTDYVGVKPPTPPLHRFPSWEAKIYEVANDGLADSDQDLSGTNMDSLPRMQAVLGGYCDINVPVYATVKGRASQIRSVPFSGESSDDSSDAEDQALASIPPVSNNAYTNHSHNSTCTDNTDNSISGNSASSPSKSLKTSSSLSPAKQSAGSDSPNTKTKEVIFEHEQPDDYAIPPDAVMHCELQMQSSLMRASYIDSPNRRMDTNTIEKTGHLVKLGGKLKTWRKRWFVLKNGILTYWKSQHDINKKPQGQIMLDESCRIVRADGASTFEIDTGKKVYYLTADSNAVMDEWVRVLQNVQKRNAAKLLLSKDDQKPTIQGWLTKVKNGHAKRCWCILLGKMFMYFKTPQESNPIGQINMRDARVEEVDHVSDSDSEENEDQSQSQLTIAIHPQQQGPTYLIFQEKQERDSWLYNLTVVSSGAPNAGTQCEQLIQKLMESDGDPNNVLWRHPILLYSKDTISTPLTSLHSESLQNEAIKLFKVRLQIEIFRFFIKINFFSHFRVANYFYRWL